jgi:hypothetical protein
MREYNNMKTIMREYNNNLVLTTEDLYQQYHQTIAQHQKDGSININDKNLQSLFVNSGER